MRIKSKNIYLPILAAVGIWFTGQSVTAQDEAAREEALNDPVVQGFLRADGFGERHADAPEAVDEFGQLAGIWVAKQELMSPNGWYSEPNAIWIWKYVLGGFATQDLWYQSQNNLPSYLGIEGRDYLLTGLRVYDAKENNWKISWASNGGGQTPGADSGHFVAKFTDGEIVLQGESIESVGDQRVVFYEIEDDSFKWRSDFSVDGGTSWQTVMRVRAIRLAR